MDFNQRFFSFILNWNYPADLAVPRGISADYCLTSRKILLIFYLVNHNNNLCDVEMEPVVIRTSPRSVVISKGKTVCRFLSV